VSSPRSSTVPTGTTTPQTLRKAGTRGVPQTARKQLILDAAGQLFARGGYHASSMDEIAALADVSKPLLYAYFGSKEGLYVAYIDRSGRELEGRLLAASGSDDDPGSRVRAPIMEFLAFVEEHRDAWIVLYSELSSSRPLAEEVARLRHRNAEAIRVLLAGDRESRPSAALSSPAVDGVAHAIVGAGESLANWWLEHPEVPREEVGDWFVSLVYAAATAAARAPRRAIRSAAPRAESPVARPA
jgi:AcrR family transcriptional regulator